MPAADEVWRLQQDDDPECRFFRARVTGKPELHRGSLQGTYIFAPSGELLARRNTNSAAHVIDMMKRALAKWEAMPRERRRPTTKNFRPKFRWENNYPKGGLALERIARDLPRDGQWSHKPAAPFNRDGVWFSAAEARLWLPAKLEAGARHEVPAALTQRLACLAIVDNVRGQTLPFHESEVGGSVLESEVLRVRGSSVDLRIFGATRAIAKGAWLYETNYWQPRREWPRATSTRVLGTATFDTKRGAFTAFRLLALGERRGRTGLNGRGSDLGPSGIGFALRLAPRTWRVAPTFINLYGASWVKMPKHQPR